MTSSQQHLLWSLASDLAGKPLESITPIDEVQVTDPHKGPLVSSPLAACYAD
jgi:hypothetical protein